MSGPMFTIHLRASRSADELSATSSPKCMGWYRACGAEVDLDSCGKSTGRMRMLILLRSPSILSRPGKIDNAMFRPVLSWQQPHDFGSRSYLHPTTPLMGIPDKDFVGLS